MSAPSAQGVPELVPARILNEHVYCPRLAYLEWVDRQFTDNDDTVEGRFVHRRSDRERGKPPEPGEAEARPSSRAVTVASERLKLIAVIDLLESRADGVVPVEYKRGHPRSAEDPLWEPELIQLCAQVLLLRDAGYRVDHAEVYFAESRTRHRIEMPETLVARTLGEIEGLLSTARRDGPPPPLVNSPKCPRCSLVGICLPDEVNALRSDAELPARRLVAGDDSAQPLYGSTPGSRLTKRGGRAVLIDDGEEVASRRLLDVSHIAVFGNVTVGSALLRACFDAGIPVLWFTAGGWLSGFATGMPSGNVRIRMRKHRAAALGSPELAAAFVAGKIRNARTLLRGTVGRRAVRWCVSSRRSHAARKERASLTRCSGWRGRRPGSTSSASDGSCGHPRRWGSSCSRSATAVRRATPSTPCSRLPTRCW